MLNTELQPIISFRTPKNTLLTVIKAGISKAQNAWWMTFLMGGIAGAYLSFGGLLSLVVAGGFTGPGSFGEFNPAYPKLIQAAMFPVGLAMVVLAGSELFTGNCMFLILPLVEKKIKFKDFCKNWFWSYLGNFIGSVAVAFFLVYLTEILATGPVHSFTVNLGAKKSLAGWGANFLKGIGANWLVCMSLFMAISSDAVIGKLLCLWWPVFTFVAIGFEHSIANMFYIPMALMEQTRDPTVKFNFGDFIAFNLIPVTLGNIVGGSFFMAGLEWVLYRDHFAGKVENIVVVPGAVRGLENKRDLIARLSHPPQTVSPLLGIRLAPSNPSQGVSPMSVQPTTPSSNQMPLVSVREGNESIRPLETDAPKLDGPRLS